MKNIYELFPKLKEKMSKEYQKSVNRKTKKLLATANNQLNNFEAVASCWEVNLAKEELKARVDLLKHYDGTFTDLGPTFDCVVFHDDKKWR